MSNESPTMPDVAFTHAINFIKLDVCIKLLSELVPCNIIHKDDLEETVTYLRALHKEISDAFDVLAEEKHTHENIHFNEEVMSEDEESDVNQPKKNHESIHD